MRLETAVRHGCKIRHRDWPPYHFAEMRPGRDGDVKLCRITPDGSEQPIDVTPDRLKEDEGWSVLDRQQP